MRTVKTIHSTLFFFLSRRKSLGGRLQPAVTFIDILCLLDYMQMKWDQIWFLAHYRTIWTITTPKKFIFCQHEQKRNNGRFNIIGTASFLLPCASSLCAAAGDLIVCKSNCTGHIWRVSLLCGYACVLSDIRAEYRSSHIGHSWKVFLLCICVCVFSDHQLKCKNSCTGHTWKAFLQCVWAYVASDEKHEHRNSHIVG